MVVPVGRPDGRRQVEPSLVKGPADDAAGEAEGDEAADVLDGGDAARGDDGQRHGGGQLGQGIDVGPGEHAVAANVSINDRGQGPGSALPGEVEGGAVGDLQPAVGGDPALPGVDPQDDAAGQAAAQPLQPGGVL